MDTLFRTPELVGLIMAAIAQFSKRTSKRTLLACSTVNRHFAQEALRIMWRELENLDHLMRLLPEDAATYIIENRCGKERLELKYRRTLVISDWDRISYYAHFVRVLCCTKWITVCVSLTDSELQFLQSYTSLFPESFLLPGLLQLEGLKLRELQVVALLPPSLRHIRVETPIDMLSKMDSILKRIRDMESLKQISLCRGISLYLDDFVTSLQGMMHLIDLTLPETLMYQQLSVVYSTIPHLERLSISTDLLPGSKKTWVPLQFPRLKELDLFGSLEGCVHVIRDLRIHPSEIISVSRSDKASSELYAELLTAIGQMESINLWFIDIRLDSNYPYLLEYGLGGANSLEGSAIYPLLKFTELQVLKLRFGFPIFVDDKDVGKILRALPEIRHLHFMGEKVRGIPIVPRLTPACLKDIAYAAPQLRSVSVWLTAEWDKLVELLDDEPSPSRLRKLNLGTSNLDANSAVRDSDILAALSDCFPLLENFEYMGSYMGSYWDRIRRSLLFDEPLEEEQPPDSPSIYGWE